MKRLRRGVRTVRALFGGRVNRQPIFVLGNQKSGTSAIAELLGRATGLSTAIDLPGLWEPVQTQLHEGKLPFERFVTRNRRDFSRAIIKEPGLTLLVDRLDMYFDKPHYVFVVRDPRDNIRSILNRLKLPGHLEQIDEAEAARRIGNWAGWRKLINGRWLGIPYSDYVGALAGRWKVMTDVFFTNSDRFILIKYEDFLADKTEAIHALARVLQLEQKFDIGDMVDRQFQPRGDHSTTVEEFFGQRNLERINLICEENMLRLGYGEQRNGA